MAEPLTLYGYHYSVYTRIARMACFELEIEVAYVEADPFAEPKDETLIGLTAFHRVPVLEQGAFVLTETAAILRYLDAISGRKSLVPVSPKAAARMAQTIGIVDNYAYVPLVRQVFEQSFVRPFMGEPSDPNIIADGLKAAPAILGTLDSIIAEGLVLNGETTLADLHLAPMIAYFDMATEGRALLRRYPHLTRWWDIARTQAVFRTSDPFATRPIA